MSLPAFSLHVSFLSLYFMSFSLLLFNFFQFSSLFLVLNLKVGESFYLCKRERCRQRSKSLIKAIQSANEARFGSIEPNRDSWVKPPNHVTLGPPIG